MFSVYHIIWIIIVIALISVSLIYLLKNKVEIEKVLTYACIGSVISEIIKTFSVLQMVPSSNGETMQLYMTLDNVPLHLCSVQIILIFIARFSKNDSLRETLLAFMYPTCTVGAAFAVFIPIIFGTSIETEQAFTHPHAYQYFLYHAMLVVLGLYILLSRKVDIRPKHYFTTLGLLAFFAFVSLYLNSMFASPTYENGELISVDFTANFFFTYEVPIDIPLTEMWHWYIYLGILIALVMIFLSLFYIPVFKRAKRN